MTNAEYVVELVRRSAMLGDAVRLVESLEMSLSDLEQKKCELRRQLDAETGVMNAARASLDDLIRMRALQASPAAQATAVVTAVVTAVAAAVETEVVTAALEDAMAGIAPRPVGWDAVVEKTVISRADLAALFEYSTTLPTGKTLGKRWRRNPNAFQRGIDAVWVIGEYFDDGTPDMVAIRWTWAVDERLELHRGDPRVPAAAEGSTGASS